ncbi:MAG: ureidoglycolate lyase [Acidimicrobiia bacterium]
MRGDGGSPTTTVEYLDPSVPESLACRDVPLVAATDAALGDLGAIVDDPNDFAVEIVPWPVSGWRALDPGTGVEGGTTTGVFEVWWEGEFLFGRNEAVDGHYLLGWSTDPSMAVRGPVPKKAPRRVLLWHVNYHPDGGQLFFPLDGSPFVVPLARPGDDLTPGDLVAFQVSGGQGLYIPPGVWHDAAFPIGPRGRFHDVQGRVHARVSCNIAREFGVLLSVPLPAV